MKKAMKEEQRYFMDEIMNLTVHDAVMYAIKKFNNSL